MIGWWENTDPSIASDLIRDFCAIFDAIATTLLGGFIKCFS